MAGFNVGPGSQPQEIPLSLFSGTDSELSPSDCPEGISPDNQDAVFVPGNVGSRPCLHKVLGIPERGPFPQSVVYQKTYIQPNGEPLTLFFDSEGVLYVEDVANSPGNFQQLAQLQLNRYCQSVSAFGREYLAFSDLLHGTGVPLQYDGSNLDRVTQDGPGTGPAVEDYIATVAISSGTPTGVAIDTSPTGATQVGNRVTIVTLSPHGFQPGQQVFVTGVGVTDYNGQQIVETTPTDSTFTYTLGVTGLAGDGGGLVFSTMVLQTTTPSGLQPGDNFQIANGLTASSFVPFDNGVGGNPTSWVVSAVAAGNFIIFSPIGAGTGMFDSAELNLLSGTLTIGGLSSPGWYQVSLCFLTRQGSLTAPSPPIGFYSTGNKRFHLTQIAIGPANVVARVFLFTGAGGGNFFTIPAQATIPSSIPGALPTVIQPTILPDNTSTECFLNFSDNALFAAVACDVPGNDLFDQIVLGPCGGVFAYASRLFWWEDTNKVNNFLNMGFAGGSIAGVTAITGWTVDTAGGTLVTAASLAPAPPA